MALRQTYTFVTLEVSQEAYEEIKSLLIDAGYTHVFHDTDEHGMVMDMHGIAIGAKPPDKPKVTLVPEQPRDVDGEGE